MVSMPTVLAVSYHGLPVRLSTRQVFPALPWPAIMILECRHRAPLDLLAAIRAALACSPSSFSADCLSDSRMADN